MCEVIFLLLLGVLFAFGEYDPSYLPMIFVGFAVIASAFIVWWRQDMSFDGTAEPRARWVLLQNVQIRKVGVWVFPWSEMMIFSSLFSTYMRSRH